MSWRWVDVEVVHAIHDRQLREHGGLPGLRDPGAVASALARPLNLAHAEPDAAALAAAYAFGLTRNHGFADGNKPTAWVVARLFLIDNGNRLLFDPADAVRTVQAVAAGTLSEGDLAGWFRHRLSDAGPSRLESKNTVASGKATNNEQIEKGALVSP